MAEKLDNIVVGGVEYDIGGGGGGSYIQEEDFSNTGRWGYYHIGLDKDGVGFSAGSDTLYTVDIPVQKGDIIETNTMIQVSSAVGCCLFDAALNRLKRLSTADVQNYTITEDDIANGVTFIAVVYRTTLQTEPFYVKRHRTITIQSIDKRCDEIDEKIKSFPAKRYCDGKIVILCGDSQLGQAQDISDRVQEVVGGTVINAGFGGCRMAWRTADGSNTYDAFCMVEVANALATKDFSFMEEKATVSGVPGYFATTTQKLKALDLGDGKNVILTIAYSSNDFSGGNQIGDPLSENKREFKGAINYSVKTLLTAFPRMTILLVGTPMRYYAIEESDVAKYPERDIYRKEQADGSIKYYVHSDSYKSSRGIDPATGEEIFVTRSDFNQAVLDQAKVLSLPGFDLYNRCGRNRYNVWTLCPSDGTHPTSEAGRQAAADFYVKIIQTF